MLVEIYLLQSLKQLILLIKFTDEFKSCENQSLLLTYDRGLYKKKIQAIHKPSRLYQRITQKHSFIPWL